MGVTGLWPILHPCARPTPLPTLNRKRLAVDASIWIYQFLKAVRDKEGNALRNSHVVGFFRRICKLLFFGIKPVFVFDGGAPVLKRQTIQGRKRKREGRREDAARTAGKLLAMQMQRRVEEEIEKQKKDREREKVGLRPLTEDDDVVKEGEGLVYAAEMGMTEQQRIQGRKFKKTDAYHLPDLSSGIEGMGQPNDPRIMSAEELEDYARQFQNGEDVNLYDFSKIDFNGEFFLSLPPVDRYNILNAARLRSRLRMGLSKEQLEEMFPDRMAFSKFQIERVRERNELTQRLMNLNGMNDADALFGVGTQRIAGERDREYVLVKNAGVEGGYALGVVSLDKSAGERNQPIDVDTLHQKARENEKSESEDEFEDVPVEGLNRLPKIKERNQNMTYEDFQAQELADQRRQRYTSRSVETFQAARDASEEPDTLFVDSEYPAGPSRINDGLSDEEEDLNMAIALSLQKDPEVDELSEQEHLNQAIALSLQKNYGSFESDGAEEFEDVPMPEYEQRAVEDPKPLTTSNGKMVAHIVNNRANAAVSKRKVANITSDSDSDMDLQAVLRKAKKQKVPEVKRGQPAPFSTNTKNPFDGPLPFEKLDFRKSIFVTEQTISTEQDSIEADLAGGFVDQDEADAPKPLPPWLSVSGDIRSQVKEQQKMDQQINAEDRENALEDEAIFRRENGPIQIDSSDDDSVVIVDVPPKAKTPVQESLGEIAEDIRAEPPAENLPDIRQFSPALSSPLKVIPAPSDPEDEGIDWSASEYGDSTLNTKEVSNATSFNPKPKSPSPEFEDIEMSPASESILQANPELKINPKSGPTSPLPQNASSPQLPGEDSFLNYSSDPADSFDEFSDPEDQELLAQLALEAESHAQFASTLNNKSEKENQESYERELKVLRSQQKKDRRDADEVTQTMITECQALLGLFGIPYITAPMEAEAQCAELVRLGLVDGVVTDDCDIFLFGGTRVYKNMFNSNKFVECYLSSDIEKELSLSRDQLIAVAQLLGSDYTEGLPGVGPVTALEILSEFPTPSTGLEEFKEWFSSVQTPRPPPLSSEASKFRKKFRKAQSTKLFLPAGFPSPAVTEAYLKPDVDDTPEPFQWGVPDLDRLREFLMATIGWTQEHTDEVLVPVIRDMNRREAEGTQTNITRYFEGSIGAGANTTNGRDTGGSKRMKEAVTKLKSKKSKGLLEKTFGEQAAEWAKKNDLGYDEEKELEKARKRKANKGKGKKKKAIVAEAKVDIGEQDAEPTNEDVDAEADDESGSGEEEEYRDSSSEKGKGKSSKRNGKGKVSVRKKVKKQP